MALLPWVLDELLEQRERQYSPLQLLFDQNFGSGLFDSDLLNVRPSRTRLLEPLVCGYLRPWRIQPQSQSGVSNVRHTKDGFQVNLDVQQFKPEEVSVKVLNNAIVVEGKHDERKDDHGFVTRSFVRRYQLPDGVDASTVSSKLSSDGLLEITAANKALPPSQERVIPIIHTNKPAVKENKENKENEESKEKKEQSEEEKKSEE